MASLMTVTAPTAGNAPLSVGHVYCRIAGGIAISATATMGGQLPRFTKSGRLHECLGASGRMRVFSLANADTFGTPALLSSNADTRWSATGACEK